MKVAALAGGVGGAKLADGLQSVLGGDLSVIVNTGDDFELHGLDISPDLDTVMYTLSGLANRATGWGLAGDTFNNLEMMARYDQENWFALGDRDLATHILRTQMLKSGASLTTVTRRLSAALGVRAAVLPMSDERVRTMVETNDGELSFQEYFVHRRWQPAVRSVRFEGIEKAGPTAAVLHALDTADAAVLCPSNPFVSIDPILNLPGLRDHILNCPVRLAVSPIVGGEALKGPAAKMLHELGAAPSALSVAQRYRGLIRSFVLDRQDEAQRTDIEALGLRVLVTDTVMKSSADRERLAREIVDWIESR